MKEISAGIIIYRKAQTKAEIKFLLVYHGGGYWNFPKGKIEYSNSAPSSVRSSGDSFALTYARLVSQRETSSPQSDIGRGMNALARVKETSWQAAVREIREEVGIKLKDLKFKKNFKTQEQFVFKRKGKKVFKTVIFYLAETYQSGIQLSREHDGYGWFTYKEAMKILSKHKDSQKILIQSYNFL